MTIDPSSNDYQASVVDHYNARMKLTTKSASAALDSELAEVFGRLDLTAEELNTAHEYFNIHFDASPSLYWSQTPALRATKLRDNAVSAIEKTNQRLQPKLVEISSELLSSYSGDPNQSLAPLWARNTLFSATIELVFKPVFSYADRGELQEQFSELLHDRSLEVARREVPNPLPGTAQPLVRAAEMRLLTEAPWAFTSRLVGSFTDVHKQIADYATKTQAMLSRVFTDTTRHGHDSN